MNGIAFQDQNEIWWLETIGGHHWMARRVPDDSYVAVSYTHLDVYKRQELFSRPVEIVTGQRTAHGGGVGVKQHLQVSRSKMCIRDRRAAGGR